MSWWTQNRKLVLPAIGLLAAQAIPGVGQALAAGLSSATGGILGGAGATEGALTAAMVPGLEATGAGSQAAMLAAQNAGLGAHGLGLTAEAAAGAQGLPQGAQMMGNAMGSMARGAGMLGNALGAVNKVAGPMRVAQGMMPQEQAPAPMPPRQQFQPTPVASPYGGLTAGMDQPPAGINPVRWARMSPEEKRMFIGREMA